MLGIKHKFKYFTKSVLLKVYFSECKMSSKILPIVVLANLETLIKKKSPCGAISHFYIIAELFSLLADALLTLTDVRRSKYDHLEERLILTSLVHEF